MSQNCQKIWVARHLTEISQYFAQIKGWKILNTQGCRASEALSNALRHYLDQSGFLEK